MRLCDQLTWNHFAWRSEASAARHACLSRAPSSSFSSCCCCSRSSFLLSWSPSSREMDRIREDKMSRTVLVTHTHTHRLPGSRARQLSISQTHWSDQMNQEGEICDVWLFFFFFFFLLSFLRRGSFSCTRQELSWHWQEELEKTWVHASCRLAAVSLLMQISG